MKQLQQLISIKNAIAVAVIICLQDLELYTNVVVQVSITCMPLVTACRECIHIVHIHICINKYIAFILT